MKYVHKSLPYLWFANFVIAAYNHDLALAMATGLLTLIYATKNDTFE